MSEMKITRGFNSKGANTDVSHTPAPRIDEGPKLDRNPRYPDMIQNGLSGGGKPPGDRGGAGGNGGGNTPSSYLSGRVSSQFEDRAVGRDPIDTSVTIGKNGKPERLGLWSVGVESWKDSRGNSYRAQVGAEGAIFSINKEDHLTIHRNGNVHNHGIFSDNAPKDSWDMQEKWVSKGSVIGTIIDKGPAAKK